MNAAGTLATGRFGPLVDERALVDLFERTGIDALVCRGGTNFTYLTEMAVPGTLGRHLDLTDSPRDMFVVVPRVGEPHIVCSEIAADYVAAYGKAEARTYRDYRESPSGTLAALLGELEVGAGPVGFDLACFGASRWAEIVEALPGLEPVDCTAAMDDVRAIKTAAEIEKLRVAAGVLDEALVEVLATVRVGETERAVHTRIIRATLERGASHVHGIFQTGSNDVLYGGEGDHPILAGDLVRTDYVAYVDGYASNVSRILHAGPPSRDTEARFGRYLDVFRASADLLRDGATGGEVHRRVQSLLAGAGFESGMPLCGHGIGCWFHQQTPLLVDSSDDVLRAGMVIALEPVGGLWHLQEEFVVTDEHPLRLCDVYPLDVLPCAS
jgi:Xaa-Pro aminopeptidase